MKGKLSSLFRKSLLPILKDKEILLATYKQLIRPILDYAAPIVFPYYSATSLLRLQRVQNRCQRIIIGCHSAASQDHLHAETAMLTVEQHLRLLASQFLARALQPHHPSHQCVNFDRGPRLMKPTLRSACLSDVEPFLTDGVVDFRDYKRIVDEIHKKVVDDAIESMGPNRVTGN